MGYVFDGNDADAYHRWLQAPRHRYTTALKTELTLSLLNPSQGESILDIGCGTGDAMASFIERELLVTGIDPSPPMLDKAHAKVAHRADLYHGYAEDLPFDDNSFNHATLITTLEFTEDPRKAIAEASRVAKDRVFIGIMNRYAIEGIQSQLKRMFSESVYQHAQFFSVWQLKQTIRSLLGEVPVKWRTVCQIPAISGRLVSKFERSRLVQKAPFGAYAGMVITLVPRFKTRPLAISYHPKSTSRALAG